jgi:hypothetical protein
MQAGESKCRCGEMVGRRCTRSSSLAMLLARSKSTRNPPVLEHVPDGSYRSDLDGLTVRIIEANLAMTGSDGSRVHDSYRLITTLLDHRCFPAADLVELYHERWEIESDYLALRHTLLNGHVLRSGNRPGLEQEIWALLTLYQLLRMAMATPWKPTPAPIPTRPASPPPWKPHEANSPQPAESAPRESLQADPVEITHVRHLQSPYCCANGCSNGPALQPATSMPKSLGDRTARADCV